MSANPVISLSSSGSIFASIEANESKVKCYDALSSNLKFTLFPSKEPNLPISSVTFCNADSHLVGYTGKSKTLMVWDLGRGVEAYRIPMQNEMQLFDITSRDGFIVALVRSDKNKRFFALEYDIESGKLTRKIKAGSSAEAKVAKIQCSPCGNFYAIAFDSQIRILHTETGKKKSKLSLQSICSANGILEFSTDGLNIFYCGDGETIIFYSVEDDEEDPQLIHDSKKLHDIVSINADENALAITHSDGTAALILLKENKSVQNVYKISAEKGKILKSNFDRSHPHEKLQIVISDKTLLCKSLIYRSEDEKLLFKKDHVISMMDDTNEKSERPNKKAKIESIHDNNDYQYDENDLTIAERLQSLKKQNYLVTSSDEDNKISKMGMLSEPKLSNTKAFSSILTQILHSNDDKTLEENVFKSKSSANRDVIVNSISALSGEELNILVCKIVQRVAEQPFKFGYNDILMSWMQAILVKLYQHEHIEEIKGGKSTQEGKRALDMMRNLIMSRVSNMEALTSLESRLAILGGDI